MVNYFIERPIFSTVIAIVTVIAGGVCMVVLPVAQYPEITPPQVQVSATYVGAGSNVVSDTVTAPLEKQINGAEGMIYMASVSANNGGSTITVTFDIGYDVSIAAADILARVSVAQPQLPDTVQRTGITINKQSPDMTMVISLFAEKGEYDTVFLSNFADINIVDELKRIPGVGQITIFGRRDYSYRVWLDPNKMIAMRMTTVEVVDAIRDQNQQVASGRVGGMPIREDQLFQRQITTLGRLETAREFEEIIVRTEPDGAVVRVKDVGRVELGAENYDTLATIDGKPSVAIAIYQLPGANALNLTDAVRKKLTELSRHFPPGVKYVVAHDSTRFVKASIREVVETLFEAILLVFLVIYVFLQSVRTTIIPAITIPVSLIGTFALMAGLGFSINTLSLLGLVLAIGLVVDDAIVVVENVERQMTDNNLGPFQAAKESMKEVTGPIIATSLVLMAVFVPIAFMPGISGRLYSQFALTIACSVGLSTVNALTLSPALCGVILKARREKRMKWFFFRWFDRGFDWCQRGYERLLRKTIGFRLAIGIAFGVLIFLTYMLFRTVPGAFVPEEDQGYFYVVVRLPNSTSLVKTTAVAEQIADIYRSKPGVRHVILMSGLNLTNSAMQSNMALVVVILKPWEERKTPETKLLGIVKAAMAECDRKINDAVVFPFNAPAIPGISSTGGFEFQVQDVDSQGPEALEKVCQAIIEEGKKYPQLSGLSTTFTADMPNYYVNLDRSQAKSLGTSITDVFQTLQVYLGSFYVNDFNKFGRVYRVYVQAEGESRRTERDITNLYVPNDLGEMIPLSAIAEVRTELGPETVPHYNMFHSALINGREAFGYSSGQAVEAMEQIAADVLPEGMRYEWTGIIYQQLQAANLAPVIFGLAFVFVYLFLGAQYESWVMPLMVMLSVPLAMFGGIGAQWLLSHTNDVYCQIGMVMLIGLCSKNSILIVEFAQNLRDQGKPIIEAAIEASHLRLRPILMTAFSFILGVIPLATASGAGAAARRSLGTTVLGGMLVSTLLSLIVTPILYVTLQQMREWCSPPSNREEKK